jgi:hypothetical protein
VTSGLDRLGVPADAAGDGHSIPDLTALPAPVRELFERAFGEATGHIFLVATPVAALALVCVLLIKEVPLRTTVLRADELEREVDPGVPTR